MRLPLAEVASVRAIIFAVALSVLRPATAVSFCQQPNPPEICAEFFSANAVFTGRVISERYLPQGLPGHDPGWLYRLGVLKTYRGPRQAVIEVYTENNSARLPLEKGWNYLLFAYNTDKVLEVYGCGNSLELSKASETLKEIDGVLKHEEARSGGNIRGRVEPSSGEAGEMAGIQVTTRGDSRIYRALTRSDGSFDIHVPAGTYSLQVRSSAWGVSPYDLSFNRPNDLVIYDGGCANVIFRATPLAAPQH
jgi:hypothetical protein